MLGGEVDIIRQFGVVGNEVEEGAVGGVLNDLEPLPPDEQL